MTHVTHCLPQGTGGWGGLEQSLHFLRVVLQKKLYGDAQSSLQNFDHLYTSKSVIL